MNTMITEEWRPVVLPGLSRDLYKVSNLGRVRSLDRPHNMNPSKMIKGRLMKFQDDMGYLTVFLREAPFKRKVSVHRLVATAFIENQTGLPEVNHRDLIKTNNAADNLEWTTRLGNYLHAAEAGVVFKRVIPEATVAAIKRNDGRLTQMALARQYGVNQSTVYRIVHGVRRRG